jgi:hypothetical protein
MEDDTRFHFNAPRCLARRARDEVNSRVKQRLVTRDKSDGVWEPLCSFLTSDRPALVAPVVDKGDEVSYHARILTFILTPLTPNRIHPAAGAHSRSFCTSRRIQGHFTTAPHVGSH